MPRSASKIREDFIEYFVQKAEHTFVPSSPVVPHDDPTLLFTNAGMNQFKDVFLGQGQRLFTRAVNSQKCIRAGGKHNDLEDVGKDTYHHTFFEMLGNWSFGDYFKADAIKWAWDLLVNIWKIDPQRLHATYFEGDASENLEPDLEARDLWLKYLPENRVHPGNKKDNFWEMGDSGPCGPCSEIHYDGTPAMDGGKLVNAGDPRVIEIWNLVFIQFNRAPGTGKLSPLPAKHVDTGMGFERITRVIQGKQSNYDTDIWSPIFMAIEAHTGAHPYRGKLEDHVDIAYRVIADHIRCLTMAITDGARPSNEGRGFVLRRILRRAVRHAHQTLGVKGAMLYQIVPAVVDSLGDAFPELKKDPKAVAQVIREEEEAFLKTLDRGIDLFNEAASMAFENAPIRRKLGEGGFIIRRRQDKEARWHIELIRKDNVVSGGFTIGEITPLWTEVHFDAAPAIPAEDAFKLHDTFGFPIDLTRVMAEERGMTVDESGFNALMEQARELSRKGGGGNGAGSHAATEISLPPAAIAQLKGMHIKPTNDADKYISKPISAKVAAIWNWMDFDEQISGTGQQSIAIITDRTNFYAESGGQVADTGRIVDGDGDRSEFLVEHVAAFGGYVLHIGRLNRGHIRVGETVQLMIHVDRRAPVRANHSATHLLNLALREIIGEGVQQKGSLVAEDRLRFDFSSPQAMKPAQIETVERMVNDAIERHLAVFAEVVPLDLARKIHGVRAVFGERYPDPVRVVSIGVPVQELLSNPSNPGWRQFSIEFCGGTHLVSSEEARKFVIVKEEALAAGVRRVTALTGTAALAADLAGAELQSRANNAARIADDLLAAEYDEIVKLTEELSIGAVRRHHIAELMEPLRERLKSLRKHAQAASRSTVVDQARALAENHNGRIIVEQLSGADKDSLLAAMDVVRAKWPEAAAMLLSANEIESKVFIVAAVPKACIDLGLKAGDWVKQAAAICGGSGGGRPDMAQAGGKDPSQVGKAIAEARAFAQQKIKG